MARMHDQPGKAMRSSHVRDLVQNLESKRQVLPTRERRENSAGSVVTTFCAEGSPFSDEKEVGVPRSLVPPRVQASWRGQLVSNKDIFQCHTEVQKEIENRNQNQYEHFRRPFDQNQNRLRMSKTRTSTTVYQRTQFAKLLQGKS